jgi:hypothetical protein
MYVALALLICGLLVQAMPGARAQQVINVGIDFRFSGLAAADQAAVIAQAQALYTAAGFGPNAMNQRVVFFDANAAGAPNPQIIVALRNNAPAGQPLGVADLRDRVATVNANTIDGALGAGANQARRNMAYGDVMAHEVGHVLSAVHQCVGPGNKRVIMRDPMTGQLVRMLMQCGGAATLMSDGECVPANNIGTNMLAFNNASTQQISAGITAIAQGQANRNMQAPARFDSLELIEGQTNREPVTVGNVTTMPWNTLVSFGYELSGRTDLFSLGWLNDQNQFVNALPESINPDLTLESLGGADLQFALMGNSGTPFAGQIFTQSDFATISLTGLSNSPGDALTPGVDTSYYSSAVVDFDVQGNQVELSLDTGMFGDHNGFLISTVPERTPAVLCLAGIGWVALLKRRPRRLLEVAALK